MNPIILRHRTSCENKHSIEEHGLLPRRPKEHNWPNLSYQPRGVYAHGVGETEWPTCGGLTVEIDVLGLGKRITRDPELPSEDSFIIHGAVPPDRISCVQERLDPHAPINAHVKYERTNTI